MKYWIEMLFDKRFSLKFKIANFIMGDLLRNYLACDLLELEKIIENKNRKNNYNKYNSDIAKRIKKDILCIMEEI